MLYIVRRAKHKLVSELDPSDKVNWVKVLTENEIYDKLSLHKKFLFADALRKKLRGVEFYKCDIKTNALWVVHPDDTYAMGYIGYGDIMKSSHEPKYFIYCRNIRNEKYSDNDDFYYTKIRGDIDAAVRVAHLHLRPYTPAERVVVDSKKVNDVIDSYRYTFSKEETGCRRAIIGQKNHESDENNLFTELYRAIEQGYQPVDVTLGEKVRDWYKAKQGMDSVYRKKLPATFVLHNSNNTFTVGRVNDLDKYAFTPAHETPVQTIDSLPEDIEGKVAVLSMVDTGHYVVGVGIRLNSGAFYVVDE